MIQIDPQKMSHALAALFVRYGANPNEAEEVAVHLTECNLQGHDSHGLIRAAWYIEKIEKKEIVCSAPITVEKETQSSAVVNGHWGFGQPVCRHAMEVAIEMAQKSVVACVAVRNANHVGRLGAYTAMASARGMVGIGMANLHGTSHCVAPFGGIDRKLPTNPISIAFPRIGTPHFLLDMTSSIVAEGKLKIRLNRGEALQEDWAIDHEGRPASDPRQFYDEPKGAILPLGGSVGYKGFALSLAIDALSGALSGAQCSNPKAKRHGNACLFLTIRIDAFLPLTDFEERIDELVSHVKASRPAPASEGIQIPGEPEFYRRRAHLAEGIQLEETTWKQLMAKAQAVGAESDFEQCIQR